MRDLFHVSATDADLLDLGWPARDHRANRVELRLLEIAPGEIVARCSWIGLECSSGGSTEQSLEATVTIPLSGDELLELALAILKVTGIVDNLEELEAELGCE